MNETINIVDPTPAQIDETADKFFHRERWHRATTVKGRSYKVETSSKRYTLQLVWLVEDKPKEK